MLANEENEQKAAAASETNLAKAQSTASSSTQSDIVSRTIALAKAKKE